MEYSKQHYLPYCFAKKIIERKHVRIFKECPILENLVNVSFYFLELFIKVKKFCAFLQNIKKRILYI